MLFCPLSPTTSLSLYLLFLVRLLALFFRYFWFCFLCFSFVVCVFAAVSYHTFIHCDCCNVTFNDKKAVWERRWHRQRLRQRQRYRCVSFFALSLSLVRFTFMYSCSFHASNRYHWVDFFPSPTSICSFTFFSTLSALYLHPTCTSLLIFSTKVMTSKSITVFSVYIQYDISWELTFPLKF